MRERGEVQSVYFPPKKEWRAHLPQHKAARLSPPRWILSPYDELRELIDLGTCELVTWLLKFVETWRTCE